MNVATRLGWTGFLLLARLLIDIGDIACSVIVIGHDVLKLRSVVLRLCAACTGKLYCRLWRTVATGMVEGLATDIHIGGMRRPVHLQAGGEPVGLSLDELYILLGSCHELSGLRIRRCLSWRVYGKR